MHQGFNGNQDGAPLAAAEPGGQAATWFAIVLTGFVARLALLVHGAPFYDDAFITFRFAANLANGNGLVWIPGEKVLGTSTPLYACLLGMAGNLFGATHIPYTAVAIGLLSYLGSCALLRQIARNLRFDALESLLLTFLFCFTPSIVLASVSGMETSFVLFLMLLAAHLGIRGSDWLAGACCVLLIATRVDAIAWVGTLFLAYVVARRTLPWRAIAVFAAGTAIWVAIAIREWGAFIPATTKAKLLAYPVSGSFAARFFGVLDTFFRFRVPLALLLIVLPFAVGAWVAYRKQSILGGGAIFYVAGCTVAFAAAGARMFPWYTVPVTLAMLFLETLGFAWLFSKLKYPRLVGLAALSLVFAVWLARDYRDNWRQLQSPANLKVGRWLQGHAAPGSTVFTEPAGWIGFYCNCRLRDSIGLVNPEVAQYWSRPGGRDRWYSTALRESRPDYVVLRQHEYSTGILFSSERVPLFATESDKQWFQQSYRMVFIANPSVPTRAQDAFFVFQRE